MYGAKPHLGSTHTTTVNGLTEGLHKPRFQGTEMVEMVVDQKWLKTCFQVSQRGMVSQQTRLCKVHESPQVLREFRMSKLLGIWRLYYTITQLRCWPKRAGNWLLKGWDTHATGVLSFSEWYSLLAELATQPPKNLPTPTPFARSCKAFCTGVPVKRMRQLDFSPRRLLAKREDMFFILAAGNADTPAPIL